jgi:hypothetical protein
MTEKIEYETPRASVRGVFLCENVADTVVSARGDILQEDWDTGNTVIGDTDWQGDIDVDLLQ